MNCQFIIHHPSGFFGYDRRCKKPGRHDTVTVPEGIAVKVCKSHLNFINKRNKIEMSSPADWFIFTPENKVLLAKEESERKYVVDLAFRHDSEV